MQMHSLSVQPQTVQLFLPNNLWHLHLLMTAGMTTMTNVSTVPQLLLFHAPVLQLITYKYHPYSINSRSKPRFQRRRMGQQSLAQRSSSRQQQVIERRSTFLPQRLQRLFPRSRRYFTHRRIAYQRFVVRKDRDETQGYVR